MKPELVKEAAQVIPDPQILINVVSRRVRQLNSGRPQLVPSTGERLGIADIALLEIIHGKVTYDESIDPNL
ncbi:DNA-directed RNA polymerase subunit omega [Sulfuriroseicoccus oceanibius]|uniref:DNA-directed RNA polymerase subunit omega n=1 Tax=Sulfuriroseicoccus oceanibius TaxID=2707525 RepID=A0A6B3L411_9BACT|nr:DNA-directed RNA polymerase subunit omega [Sulfuriroseicoccus oceanibius]QQL45851.1 DNA-directed RNA polymerase subunit omega [Sulfuriroseicoccus oceanibius]